MDHDLSLRGDLDLFPTQLQKVAPPDAVACTLNVFKFWDISFQFAKNNSSVLLPISLGYASIPNSTGADHIRGYAVDVMDGHTLTLSATPVAGSGINYSSSLLFWVQGLARYDLFKVKASPRGNNVRCRIVLRAGGHLAIDKTNIDSSWTTYSLDMIM